VVLRVSLALERSFIGMHCSHMAAKKPVQLFEHPIPAIDLEIIANARLEFLKKAGVAPFDTKGYRIKPFRCYARGYLLQDGIILMFDPERFDVRTSALTVRQSEPPFEVWILQDDRVVNYFELGGEGESEDDDKD
jgi:hypothetical protein